jgi:glycosyltransferase involved in cell wall biosynthesis
VPQVTVIIDTFNHEHFVAQALRSVLAQDFRREEMEILVVDDGSKDRTTEIVRQFEPDIRLITKVNGGQASAFNQAISEAHGEIIAFLDGDDWWTEDKLSHVVRAFNQHPHVAAVGHSYYEISGDDLSVDVIEANENCFLDLSSPAGAQRAILGRSLLGTSRLAIRKNILDRIVPLPVELIFCADTPILTSALALGGAIILSKPLCYYRIHGENLFMATGEEQTAKLERLAEILQFLLDYIPEKLRLYGVPEDTVRTYRELDRLELDKIDVKLHRLGRWKGFKAEIRSFTASYRDPSAAYLIFKCAVAFGALTLGPNRLLRVRSWYARHNLHRLRLRLTHAEPVAPPDLFRRRQICRKDGPHA